MKIKNRKLKKPWFPRLRQTVLEKWERFFAKNQTKIGIIVIILFGAIACSPILVFSSMKFLSSIPIFYKILVFLLFTGLFLYDYFNWTFKYVSEFSKILKTYYGWEDGIAVLLLIYGIYSFSMQPTLGFLKEFRAELIGAGIATLLIGNASQADQMQEEKKRLKLQMGSPDNGLAVEAVQKLREQGWLTDGSLKSANLFKSNLSRMDLRGANLSGAVLLGAKLNGADLRAADLSEADLREANLAGTTLYKAKIIRAYLELADLNRANLYKANLSGADLKWTNLSMAYLTEANLSGADLRGADLSGANLEKANLSRAFLAEANLSGANLKWTNLSGANLQLANLNGANLWQANLSGTMFFVEDSDYSASFDETTIWADAFYTEGENGTVFPKGFNPADYGMHLIRENETYEEALKRVFPNQ